MKEAMQAHLASLGLELAPGASVTETPLGDEQVAEGRVDLVVGLAMLMSSLGGAPAGPVTTLNPAATDALKGTEVAALRDHMRVAAVYPKGRVLRAEGPVARTTDPDGDVWILHGAEGPATLVVEAEDGTAEVVVATGDQVAVTVVKAPAPDLIARAAPAPGPFPTVDAGALLADYQVRDWLRADCVALAAEGSPRARAAAAGHVARRWIGELTTASQAFQARLRGEASPEDHVIDWAASLDAPAAGTLASSVVAGCHEVQGRLDRAMDAPTDGAQAGHLLDAMVLRDELASAAFVAHYTVTLDPVAAEAMEAALKAVDRAGAAVRATLGAPDPELTGEPWPESLRAVGGQEPGAWWGLDDGEGQ